MTSNKELDGTVALVTGASSGIGEATALTLAERGAAVALVARRRDRLETLAGKISESGGRSLVIEADVTSREQADAAVATVLTSLDGSTRWSTTRA
jgi:NADP-dependent 3-hydroxy acid dehydrogenase YdfG